MGPTLTPILTSTAGTSRAYNPGIAETYSWVPIEGEALGRPLYAQANYITNFSDLQISLSSSSVDIGSVHISDEGTGVTADVVAIPGYGNGLQVLTQDLESTIDDITIGDKQGHFADVDQALSALNVKVVNTAPLTANITNTVAISGLVTVTNPVTAVTVLNALSATVINTTALPTTYADDATVDAFSRLRVSQSVTLFDSKQLHQMSTLWWSNTASSDGRTYFTTIGDASITLSVSANNGYAIRQSRSRFNYQSGKSMLYMFTGILNPETNIIKRYGCFTSLTAAPFDPTVGLYFEASNGTISVVQNNDGFLVPSVSADRNNWNIDKLDGTGPSRQVMTLSGTNIFVIDYEWLGVGRARFGIVKDGRIYYCHKINNDGKTGAYLATPNHPLRAEIRQTAAEPVSGSMKMICATVISEGGSDFSGATRSVDSGTIAVENGNNQGVAIGTRNAILGVRLQANKLDSVNQLLNAGVMMLQAAAATSSAYRYEVVLNPVLTSPGVWYDLLESNFQYWNNTTATAPASASGGTVIASGFGSTGATVDLGTFNLQKFLRLGSTINGVRDELYLVVTALEPNKGAYGSLAFIESD